MKKISIGFLLLFLVWGFNDSWAEGIAVIVNRDNAVETLSLVQLANIYKGQLRQWPEGGRIMVVNRSVGSATRRVFYKKVLRSTPTKKFQLAGSPIPFSAIVQRSSLATIRFVNNLPEAIGYIFLSEMELDETNKAVKIIRIIELEDNPVLSSEAK